MADTNHQSNHGRSPFRRYEPAASNRHDTPITPMPQSPAAGAKPSNGLRGLPRHSQNDRSRWRQWINSASRQSAHTASGGDPPLQSPSSETSSPSAPRRPLQSPLDAIQAARPKALNEPSRFVQESVDTRSRRGRSHPGQPRRPGGSAPRRLPTNRRSSQPATPPHHPSSPTNKVMPLHPRPAWESPNDRASGPLPQRRDRTPRRSPRKPPKPVLYGIRLLILGTGIAAIAGTILSSLKANQTVEGQTGADTRPTLTDGRPHRRANDASPVLSQPLPFAAELVAVETDLVALESMTPGLDQAVFFYDLETGNYIDLNGSAKVSAASTIKVPILVAFLHAVDAGTIRLEQAITLREDMIASGSGDMQFDEPGTRYTALDVATEMIINSDNTATNLIIALLGGTQALNQQFRSWGLESTLLQNLLPDLEGTNTTSSADLVRVMALVDNGELLSLRSRDRLFSIMQRTYNRSLIPDGLTDETALTYNKTGDIGTALGDVALVDVANGNRYIVSVLVQRPFNDGRASELIRRVAGRVHEQMSQPINPLGAGGLPADATVPSELTAPPLETPEIGEPDTAAPHDSDVAPDSLQESEPASGPDGIPPG